MKKQVYLVCNAHLDPVWMWEWEEGAAEAISTFRTAADLCEAFDGFVFNHNEVILYRWIAEYEPALFERIQKLVKAGKWHIMGGWYLQPDCNMPSGESFVRQILAGRKYFAEQFGARPHTAINFDPFGHSHGLPQILAKSGYDSYLFCRPPGKETVLPDNEFVWVGPDGSEVMGTRATAWYNSRLGGARAKVEKWMDENADRELGILLWGVGNHGGGPSRADVAALQDLIAETDAFEIQHATPEAYFGELAKRRESLPRHESDINPWGVGCYTSMVRVKQKHRALENALYMTEKMLSTAAMQGLMDYPGDALEEAQRDLLFAQFHDILPGSSIQPVEETSLRLMDHGLEILSRIKARAFFALASGQPKAAEGEIPVLVYNPHPYPVETVVECEFQLADQNREEVFTQVTVMRDGEALPTQVEEELGNINMDWRKRVVFRAELAPSRMNRFDCALEEMPEKPPVELEAEDGQIRFLTDDLDVIASAETGLIDRLRVRGVDCVREGAFRPLVVEDDEDPWGMRQDNFPNVVGAFELMPPEEGTAFSGVTEGTLPSVRVIEDGEVRTVIEAVFAYGRSALVQRYKLPKAGTEIEVETRVQWAEKDKMLKLAVPTPWKGARYVGQTAFAVYELPANGDEAVAQKWTAVVSDDAALTCINPGTYGSDFNAETGEMRLSLLRSPAYAAHPIEDRPLVKQDRFTERIDQGERLFRFWFNVGVPDERLAVVDREALAHNEEPFALSFFPSGSDAPLPTPGITLSDGVVQMAAFKRAETGEGYVIRLFEPSGQARTTTLSIPALDLNEEIALGAYEIKTLVLDPEARTLAETDLMEDSF
jgi:alpha-mannosidase